MTDKWNIALYLRVSAEEEGDEKESSSILNQRILLRMFAAKVFEGQDIEVSEFADDGYSGTTLCRPAMERLLKQSRNGKVDCIMVKDFSRFSRDYIEMGAYLEQIFPFLGIRFISVNDHYDSSQYTGKLPELDKVFQYLVNDLYAKDISAKVKTSLAAKKGNGQYANGSTPFGYRKSPCDSQILVPVEPEAGLVRRVFCMAADGYSSTRIARQFNQEGVKTPVEYQIARGITSRKPKGTEFLWEDSMICRILKNEFYTGDLVYGKYETEAVGKKAVRKPEEQWKRFKNHHKAIIDRETYELAQKSRGRKGKALGRKKHPLTGKMVCGFCGKNMKLRHTRHPYFYCPTRYKTDSPCCIKKVSAEGMEELVLCLLWREAVRQADMDGILRFLTERWREQEKEDMDRRERLPKEMKRIQEEKARAYRRYREKELTESGYRKEESRLQKEEQRLLKDLGTGEERMSGQKPISETAMEASPRPECGGADLFVRKIVVQQDSRVELTWNFHRKSVRHLFNT